MEKAPLLIPLFWAVLWLAPPAHGEKGTNEVYSDRPTISDVAAKPQTGLMSGWTRLKQAHTEALAQMIELYPEHEIYFLGRDAEYLHDLGQILTVDEAGTKKRMHLLNVSRINLDADHLMDYLKQEGISEQTLASGKKVLLVDTGFSGSIPMGIMGRFSEISRRQIQSHLMVSVNPGIPSSRTFLATINPESIKSSPALMQGTVLGYEAMPRYTHRSSHFLRKGSRWEPGSSSDKDEGVVSRKEAIRYMEDLKYYGQQADTRAAFTKVRERWRRLRQMYRTNNLAALKEELQYNLDYQDPVREAQVRDFMEWTRLQAGAAAAIDLGLAGQAEWGGDKQGWQALAMKHPEWTALLNKPDKEIPKLLAKQDIGTLGLLTDILQDAEFWEILATELAKGPPSDKLDGLVMAMIKNAGPGLLAYIGTHLFSKKGWNTRQKLLDIYLYRAYQSASAEGGAYEIYGAMNAAFYKSTPANREIYRQFLLLHTRDRRANDRLNWSADPQALHSAIEQSAFGDNLGQRLARDLGDNYKTWPKAEIDFFLDGLFKAGVPNMLGMLIRHVPVAFWKANPKRLQQLLDGIAEIEYDELKEEYRDLARKFLGEGATTAGCKRWMAAVAGKPKKKKAP